MKRILLAISAVLTIYGQQAAAQIKSGTDTLIVDQVEYRITYDAKQVNDTTQTPYIYQKAQMRLDIGKNISRFYNQSYMDWAAQVKQMIYSGGGIDLSKAQPVRCMVWEFYKNYPEQGQTLYQESAGGVKYQCIEAVEAPEWQIVADSTASIIGYGCQLAKTQFKGRTWYAWYAEDLPLSEGPWKLCGLPGLILRAYDAQRQFSFEAVGLESLKGSEPLKYLKPQNKAEKVSQADLVKIKQREDGLQKYRDAKIYDADGNPIKPKARKKVFNPIER